MRKSEIIREIEMLHYSWAMENKAEEMQKDTEILLFHTWLLQNHGYLFNGGSLKPEGSHQRVAMIVQKKRGYRTQ